MKKVLVNKPIHEVALERLREEVEVLTPFKASREKLLEMLPEMHAVVLCAGLKLGGAEMDLATNLEVIGRHGAGVDIVDIEAATERGIPVTFTPHGPTESTAEHAFMLMLATARRLSLLDSSTRSGNFHIRDRVVGQELAGKAVGIVGFGRIGRRMAEMCRDALQMTVYAYDPYVDAEETECWGAVCVEDLVTMAGEVDVLSIHAPSNADTHRLVSREVIEALKPNAILVNVSRGPVVDETALIDALEEERIWGAGLDVYDPEPPSPDNPLFRQERVTLTPHLASFTDEGRQRMGLMAAEDVLSVLRGEAPRYLFNTEVWSRRRTPQS